MTRRWAFATIGLAAGFSGLAVVLTILSGLPLVLFEVALGLVPVTVGVAVARRAPLQVRRDVWRAVRAGMLAGLVATVVYDASRTGLSLLDPSPYRPFEALRAFGASIWPEGTALGIVMVTGFSVHALNGASFGVIYAVFGGRFTRRLRAAALSGLAWGLTLEFIQSILYPGWLQITTVLREFLVISALGHVAYGLTLGLGVWYLLGRPAIEEEPQ